MKEFVRVINIQKYQKLKSENQETGSREQE